MNPKACAALLLLWPAALAGCGQPERPVFPAVWPSVEWPSLPDRARIRYVGQLTGEASLGKARPWSFKELIEGPPPSIGFSTPMSVAVIGDRAFVADGQNGAVYAIDIAAKSFKTIDRVVDGRLQWPIDVIVAGEQLVIVDSKRAGVFVFDRDGRHLRTIGQGALQRPTAAAYNAQSGDLWVLDAAQHACIAFDLQGSERRRVGQRGAGPGEFNFPAGITFSDKLGLVVADSMNFRVQILDETGAPKRMFGRKGDAAGDFALPRDVAVDSEGHIFVLDNQFENVQIFDGDGKLLLAFGQEGRKPGEFYLPAGICIDARDRVWIADSYNRRIQVFQYLSDTQVAQRE